MYLFKKISFTVEFLILLLWQLVSYSQNTNDTLIVAILKSNNIKTLDSLITAEGIKNRYFNHSQTLLTLAITNSNLETIKYLIDKGADVDVVLGPITPIILCAMYDRDTIADLLLKNGAKVDGYNLQRNTPLILAARFGSLNTIKILMRYRANPYFKNFQNYNSLEISEINGKIQAAEILKDYMVAYSKGIYPSCFDGPHFERLTKRKGRIFYLVNDSLNSRLYIYEKIERISKDFVRFKGFLGCDTLTYSINLNKTNIITEKQYYNKIKNIFAVGDVHGEYDSLVKLLKSNNIIDSRNNWIFGDGHLVFIGDIVDRGEKVTEVLWLLNKLKGQARLTNGYVHLLLGNHEQLVLGRDYRYLHEKYQILTRGNRMDYADLFKSDVFPGSLIRSFKGAVVIDSILFTHAGISPQFSKSNIPISRINNLLHLALNAQKSYEPFDIDEAISIYETIISDIGILWYRGYLMELPAIKRANQQEINAVLNKYGVKAMVIGHTEVNTIEPLYEGKLFPINVPFSKKGVKPQGLLIDSNGNFWRCFIDGTKLLIQ